MHQWFQHIQVVDACSSPAGAAQALDGYLAPPLPARRHSATPHSQHIISTLRLLDVDVLVQREVSVRTDVNAVFPSSTPHHGAHVLLQRRKNKVRIEESMCGQSAGTCGGSQLVLSRILATCCHSVSV